MSESKQEASRTDGTKNTFYLGDGAYVRDDRDISDFVVIFTHNGYHPTNSVFLGRNELEALRNYLEKLK